MSDKSIVNTVSHLIFGKYSKDEMDWEQIAVYDISQGKDWSNGTDLSATDVEGRTTFPEAAIIRRCANTAQQGMFCKILVI